MPLTIKHSFQSELSDKASDFAAGKVTPSRWNSEHAITGSLEVGDYDLKQVAFSGDFEDLTNIPLFNHPGYIDEVYYPQSNGGVSVGTAALATNRIMAVPFYCNEDATATKIGFNVTTGTGSASDLYRLGIFENSGGLPSDLVVDAGEISVETTGEKEITISQALSARTWYWLALQTNAASATVTAYSTSGQLGGFGITSGSGNGGILRITRTYDVMPATFPALTAVNFESAGAPRLWLRFGV